MNLYLDSRAPMAMSRSAILRFAMRSSTTAWRGQRPSRAAACIIIGVMAFMSRYKKNPDLNRVLVTGGAGYVGAVLVPKLLAAGYQVTVLDLYLYGEDVLKDCRGNPGAARGQGRHPRQSRSSSRRSRGATPSSISPASRTIPRSSSTPISGGRSISTPSCRWCAPPRARASKRFIYASSSSVYGVKEGVEVTEDLSLEPLTDYSKFKAECEVLLEKERAPGFITVTIRPATVCGYSPRQRLDVVVNILTNLGCNKGEISVFGGVATAAEHPYRGHDRRLPAAAVGRRQGRRRQGLQRRVREPLGDAARRDGSAQCRTARQARGAADQRPALLSRVVEEDQG